MLQTSLTKTTFLKKHIACFVAGLTAAAFLLMLGNGGNVYWLPPSVIFPLAALCIIAGAVYPALWHYLEKKGKTDSAKKYAFLYSLIRYGIAFSLAGFGWKKLFGLQFVVPEAIAALPMNRQSGEWLTWYYFGYSAVFGNIIAMIQIGGACLLLFRKTLLFGSVVLFALMLNLMLVNICYGMNTGALVQSVVLTAGLLFLILSDYSRLVDFIFRQGMNLHESVAITPALKNMLKISAIVLSLMFTLYLKYYN